MKYKLNMNTKVVRWHVLLVSMLLIAVVSCKKDYTESIPMTALSDATAFNDAPTIELVANGMYYRAAVGNYSGGGGRAYPFGAASIEQAEMRGEDMVNLETFYAITYQSTISASSANNLNHWEQLYALINQANVLIAGVQKAAEDGIITNEVATSYEGEARFLRALSHHELLIHFCRPYADGNGSAMGVPYRNVAISSSADVEAGIAEGRGTVAEDYQKILEDLDMAEQQLPETQPRGFARATKGAAIALKTRIKLHMGDWQGVIAEGKKLGTDDPSANFASPIGGYHLEADPTAPFNNFESNAESIFSIAASAASNGGVNGALPAMFSAASVPPDGATAGRGLVALSPNLYNASFWVTGDKRREMLVQQFTEPKLWFTNKYWDYSTRTNWAPIIRYAEVLLNVAEAKARVGDQANMEGAFLLLNAVRNRSVPAADQFASMPSDMILTILNERRVELSAEGRRWPDIHRLALDPVYGLNGIPAKILKTDLAADGSDYDLVNRPFVTPSVGAIPYEDFRFLWPIPSTEVSANATLRDQQNPGYK